MCLLNCARVKDNLHDSTELLAFKRQKDGYKVTVKISLSICVVQS